MASPVKALGDASRQSTLARQEGNSHESKVGE
jgi:hypothetical protein